MYKKISIFTILMMVVIPSFAREGSVRPAQSAATVNSANRGYYQSQGYTDFVGQNGNRQILDTRTSSYQVPRQVAPVAGSMTPNGIAMPVFDDSSWILSADFARRFANFEFKTGVNSILKWDDMIINQVNVGLHKNFEIRDYDLFVSAGFSYGSVASGGLSMDYDLMPYDENYPDYGIFTISMGDMSGDTTDMKFAFGVKNAWDIGGWKLSPSIGYEIFKHNLEMSNHIYPNPGVMLPLMTKFGDYIFGDNEGNYYSVPQGTEPPADLYQVCLSPEDIAVAATDSSGRPILSQNPDGTYSIVTEGYNPAWDTLPWGVGPGECVIIGGDGAIKVPGTTHIYNTTWSGLFIGMEMEKQMTFRDKLRLYFQFGMPKYSSEGIWPNRTDWQQNPSFIDEGNKGAYNYRAEIEYNFSVSERLQLTLKADMDFFYVGKIPGTLYVAEYSHYLIGADGQYLTDASGYPILETVAAHEEKIEDSLTHAKWQSFGLHIGAKYSF